MINLIGFSRPSVQTELDRFYKSISTTQSSFESVSKSAFTQSRKKLKPEVFIDLADDQLTYFRENAPIQNSWKESRIVAIDGSLLNLPHTMDVEDEFGGVSNQHEKVVSARCSFAYDVCNELVLDAAIAPRKSCEKDLAEGHLASLDSSTDILVFDRGYPSQWLIGLLMKENFKFCFRLSTAWKKAVSLMDGKENDLDWTMKHNTHKCCDQMKRFKIPKQLKGLRLVAIDLPSGEKEILLTNLTDKKKFNIKSMKELYHLRWGVEEGYKVFKKTLHIEHFSGRSAHAVKQDFYARVFMLNMGSMVRSQAVSTKRKGAKRKHKMQANKTQVLAKLKDFLTELFYSAKIKKAINQMLKILNCRLEILRPDRSFPRPKTSSRRRSKIINYKGI